MLASKVNKMNRTKPYIQDCRECHRICEEMARSWDTQAKQTSAAANLVRLLRDCAAICEATADFMASDSDLQGRFSGACVEMCVRCAEACERFENDIQMQVCADACRRCAQSCRQMAIKPIVTSASRAEWIGELADLTHAISPAHRITGLRRSNASDKFL